ncbi:MAG: ABC transporter permease [Deltaproteobacteria bacterium]|nr:ABC transporter permease [Deltaproteobacteria bacterium]
MDTIETISSCFQQFRSHPLRTFLTFVCIVIGVASLIAMVGIGKGTAQRVVQDMERLGGAGLIIIQSPEQRQDEAVSDFNQLVLTRRDLKSINSSSVFIEKTAPVTMLYKQVYFQKKSYGGQCLGITPQYQSIRGWSLRFGRFILDSDIEHRKRVCVLGSEMKAMLFSKEANPIGRKVRIGSEEFTVVGLMASRNFEAGRWMNYIIMIPFSTMESIFYRTGQLDKILVKVNSTKKVPTVTRQILRALGTYHRYAERFNIFSQAEVIRSVNQSTLLLRLSQVVSAIIVLLVGGIGIMNLMLVSITERTKEIGLRKALGATDMDIMLQFLTEAVIISMAGGIIGIVAGLMLGGLSSLFIAHYFHDTIHSIVSLKDVGLATGFVFLMGIFFGLYPASRAARLDPSKALSYE